MPIDDKALSSVTSKVMAYNPNNKPLFSAQGALFIEHQVAGEVVAQRPRDGYINATALCRAAGRELKAYLRTQQTKAFLTELSRSVNIFTDQLVHIIGTGPNEGRGTWVHPQVAVNLGQWASPEFAVLASKWVFDWMGGKVASHIPIHIKRYLLNRRKVPHTHFSMLNEIYLNLLAPLEDQGFVLPDKMMPDISTGMMFSSFLKKKGISPDKFPKYEHEFIGGNRQTVFARLYPIEHLADFRTYFNEKWLPKQAEKYFKTKAPKALEYLPLILPLPSP